MASQHYGEFPFRPGTKRIDMEAFIPKFKHRPKLPTKMVNVNLDTGEECVFTFGSSASGLGGNGGTKYTWKDVSVPTLNKELCACSVIDLNCGKKVNIISTTKGTYCWGSCVYGNCIPGSNSTAMSRPKLIEADTIPGEDVQFIHSASSYFTTVALSSDGDVFKWGSVEWMKMTLDPTVEKDHFKIANPVEKIPSLCRRRIVQLAAGSSHFLALNAGGSVYSWGQNNFGKLGHKDECALETPKLIQELKWLKVYATWVACGDEHSIVVGYMMNTDNDKNYKEKVVLSFGKWDERLGMGDKYPRTIIKPVIPPKPNRRSLMRNSYEELYAMAKDLNIEKKQAYDVLLEHIMEHLWEEHRINVENLVKEAKRLSIPRMPYPKLIPALRNSNVVKAYCGESFSLLLNDNGGVLSFGNNSHSQLGLGDSVSRGTPTPIRALQNISFCATGGRFAAAVDKFGELWMWGDATHGQLGFGDHVSRSIPRKNVRLHGYPVNFVQCGQYHTVVVCKRPRKDISGRQINADSLKWKHDGIKINLQSQHMDGGAVGQHDVKPILAPPIFEYKSMACTTLKSANRKSDENMIYTKDGKTRYNIKHEETPYFIKLTQRANDDLKITGKHKFLNDREKFNLNFFDFPQNESTLRSKAVPLVETFQEVDRRNFILRDAYFKLRNKAIPGCKKIQRCWRRYNFIRKIHATSRLRKLQILQRRNYDKRLREERRQRQLDLEKLEKERKALEEAKRLEKEREELRRKREAEFFPVKSKKDAESKYWYKIAGSKFKITRGPHAGEKYVVKKRRLTGRFYSKRLLTEDDNEEESSLPVTNKS